MLLFIVPFVVCAETSEKEFIIKGTAAICAQHNDQEFCRWQVENLIAISGVISLEFSDCYRHHNKDKKCKGTTEAFNYIQNKYKENVSSEND